jgi:hypothetical protein
VQLKQHTQQVQQSLLLLQQAEDRLPYIRSHSNKTSSVCTRAVHRYAQHPPSCGTLHPVDCCLLCANTSFTGMPKATGQSG